MPVIESGQSRTGGQPCAVHHPRITNTRAIGATAIRRGLLINAFGALGPALVAIVFMRAIVDGLGHARFGVLTLAWTFINAVGILDLGVGRALTRFLAVHEEQDVEREASIIWTSLVAITALGTLGGAVVWGVAASLGINLAHGDPALEVDTIASLRVLSVSVPLVVLSSGLRGILEAFGRFDLTNRISVPLAVLNVLVPAALLQFPVSLPVILATLVALRFVAASLLLRATVAVIPAMKRPRLGASGMRSVLSFAGWVTVSNVPGPLFAQAERYLLGSTMALTAVGFYSTPADILTRITILPAAILQVMFPVFAQTIQADRDRAARLATRGLTLVTALVGPPLVFVVAVAPEGLRLWLGPEFAIEATRAARLLAGATFINCMAWLPFSLIQSAGRADLTGKLHALEIPVYLTAAAMAIRVAGIDGAATANLVRAVVDAAVVVWMAHRILGKGSRLLRRYVLFVAMGLVAMLGAAASVPVGVRLLWAVMSLLALIIVGWRMVLDGAERDALVQRVALVWSRMKGTAR